MRNQYLDSDYLSVAKKLEDSWAGLSGGDEPHYLARDLRNHLCQVMNRHRFSSIPDKERVSGDALGFMRQMICSLLKEMVDWSDAPRGGLASVLRIHQTRMADMLERRIWPEQIDLSLRQVVLHSALWTMLGAGWKTMAKQVAVPVGLDWSQRDLFPQLRPGHKDWAIFWKSRYAEDVVDYFFPFPDQELQPYFDIRRRDWTAPFDRHELGLIIRWTRRQVKATKKRGYIAFFVPTYETARKLFDEKEILPQIAFAARETDLLSVNVFYPRLKGDQSEMSQLEGNMDAVAEGEVQRHRRWGSSASLLNGNNVAWDPSDRVGAGDPALRSFLAFMFSSYVRQERNGLKRHVHLYFIRPFCDGDDSKPFAMEGTTEERKMFIDSAIKRHAKFAEESKPFLEEAEQIDLGL